MAEQYIHFDPFSGISGDMTLGALIDLGLDINLLRSELGKLAIAGYQIEAEHVNRNGINAVRCIVRIEESRSHRHLHHIERIIHESSLDAWIKEKSVAAFTRLAQAESKVHGIPVEKVHFHEVGAVDAIVDVVGSMIGFFFLGIRHFGSAAVNVGGGQVSCEHGLLPVPAPATAELLKGIPVYGRESAGELTTPTGAAILTSLCSRFGPLAPTRIKRIGYGAGSKTDEHRPNVLRLILGEVDRIDSAALGTDVHREAVAVIEANLDDMSPQLVGHFSERILEAGALDVIVAPVQMKKGRPGCLLSVVCLPADLDRLMSILFAETTTLGARYRIEDRAVLQREVVEVKIPQGAVRVKIGRLSGRVVNVMPEYEDCRALALESGEALKVIQNRVLQEFMNRFGLSWGQGHAQRLEPMEGPSPMEGEVIDPTPQIAPQPPEPKPEPKIEQQPRISIEEFARLELRAGEVLEAERVPGSKKLIRMIVDLGNEKRQVVAGIGRKYAPETLLRKKVILVANLQPARLMGLESNGMVLAAVAGEEPILAGFQEDVPNGARLR